MTKLCQSQSTVSLTLTLNGRRWGVKERSVSSSNPVPTELIFAIVGSSMQMMLFWQVMDIRWEGDDVIL